MVKDLLKRALTDFSSNRTRFILEAIGWLCSVSGSIILAITMPNPAFHILYPVWFVNTGIFAYAAWSRGSTFMFCNFILLTIIDAIGCARWAGWI